MQRDDLIKKPLHIGRHIVLLGAGASKAAFLNGDASGKKLPIMSDFVDILSLTDHLKDYGLNPSINFEELYSSIVLDTRYTTLKEIIESRVYGYFSSLSLPANVTHYDRLILSLQEKDAILTFNWDPFLFDAYERNRDANVTMPGIFFLHGNVRIGACVDDGSWGKANDRCYKCGKIYTNVPLLYPIEKKNYSENSSKYISTTWEEAQLLLNEAFTITIFGYGAPHSDVDAIELLKTAWFKDKPRDMEHIEVIDIDSKENLATKWSVFTPTNHYSLEDNFRNSRLWRWPRRSCEAIYYPMSQGLPCEDFPFQDQENLIELQNFIKSISAYE